MTDARLITGDARVVLADLPAESVDCVIADPPYGETSLTWDRWPDGWPTAVLRVLKPTGSMWVFGSLRMFLRHRDEFDGWAHRQEIVWEKHNGSNAAADRFRRVHELVVQYVRADQPASQVYTKGFIYLTTYRPMEGWLAMSARRGCCALSIRKLVATVITPRSGFSGLGPSRARRSIHCNGRRTRQPLSADQLA